MSSNRNTARSLEQSASQSPWAGRLNSGPWQHLRRPKLEDFPSETPFEFFGFDQGPALPFSVPEPTLVDNGVRTGIWPFQQEGPISCQPCIRYRTLKRCGG